MSHSDPMVLNGYSATAALTGGTPTNFSRQREGTYMATNLGTPDEPVMLYLSNNYRPGDTSIFSAKLTVNKNAADIGGVPQKDHQLVISHRVEVPWVAFDVAALYKYACLLGSLTTVNEQTYYQKASFGER